MKNQNLATDSNPLFTSKDVNTPCSESHDKKYRIPTLEDFSHNLADLPEEQFPGGEQEALRTLEEHVKRTVLEHD